MARIRHSDASDRWRGIQIITKPQNRAIIHLLSDKKPRMPVEICRELKEFSKATLYTSMKELTARKILVPMLIEMKEKPWRRLTELLGYTLDEDVFDLIKILDEADKEARDISNKG